MAVVYPLNLPSTPKARNATWRLDRGNAIFTSPFSGRQQVQRRSYALWAGTYTLPTMLEAQAREWISFFTSLDGVVGTFLMGNPDFIGPMGNPALTGTTLNRPDSGPISTATGSIHIATGAGQTDISVDVGNTATGSVGPGDYIQIGIGLASKLYMVNSSFPINVLGHHRITISPGLRAPIAVNDRVTFVNPVGLFRLATNDPSWSTDHNRRYSISFPFVEALT